MGIDERTADRLEEIVAATRPRLLGFLSPKRGLFDRAIRLEDRDEDDVAPELEPV